jgi:NAD(P)-dependent dehydrogenase (short-subunit alcohol dehydrogenase family)
MSAADGARRVCLLTGAGGRLGVDFCQRYAADYDIVAVVRRRTPEVPTQHRAVVDPLALAGAPLPENANPVYTITSDLCDEDALERVVEVATARYDRIDLLVNAAVHVRHERLISLSDRPDLLDEHFHLNASVPIRLAAIVARACWVDATEENRARNRNVVNVSSMAGLGFVPGVGLAPYSASKAALNFLSCHLAEEFRGLGVRVNVLAPTAFPELVPTSAVSDQLVAFDRGRLTGRIAELDERGRRFV